MPPSLLWLLQVAITLVISASISPTSTPAASVRSHQAEAQATPRCLQASQALVLLPQDTLQPRLATRLLLQASAARALVPRLQAMQLPALSIRLRRQATRQPRPPMARLLRRHIPQHLLATHRHRRLTRPRRQVTALPRQRIVVRLRRTTVRHRLHTVQRHRRTALQARNSVRPTTGARLHHPLPRRTALLVRSTLPQALLAMQRTRLHLPSSLPRLRVRHHTRRLRQSGRRLAPLTRRRKFHWS